MKKLLKRISEKIPLSPYYILRIGVVYTFIGAVGTAMQFITMRENGDLSYMSVFRESVEGLIVAAIVFVFGAAAVSGSEKPKSDK